ncbi:hypothetical protein ACTFIU_000056, partial [Dictyostelium citrinum]
MKYGIKSNKEERSDTDSVPTNYQVSDTLLDLYKPLIENQVNVAPFCTPEGITASSTLKNNYADLFMVVKRINDSLKPLLLMLTMTTNDRTNLNSQSKSTFKKSGGSNTNGNSNFIVIVSPVSSVVGLVADLTTSMDQKVVSHQVALSIDDAIEQLQRVYSTKTWYESKRPVLDLKRLNTFIANQSFKMEVIKNLPSMVKQGFYMVKLDIKKAYLHVLVD